MSLINEFNSYIKDKFKNQCFKRPLFYNFDIGLRFELGNPNEDNDTLYFKQAFQRAIDLFEATHDIDDEIYLVYHKYKHINSRKVRNSKFLQRYLNNKDYKITGTSVPYQHDAEEEEIKQYQILIKCKVSDVKYERLLRKCNNEFYIININKETMFFMYDTRGLDIVSNSIDNLRPIYLKHNDWILNYDRKKIDDIFMQ